MTPEEYIAMVEEENKNLRDYADNLDSENDNQAIEIEELKKENKKLNEKYNGLWDIYTRDVNERIEENKKLKAELSKYKKQYQHSMGFMEEDTLQELRDIGEI